MNDIAKETREYFNELKKERRLKQIANAKFFSKCTDSERRHRIKTNAFNRLHDLRKINHLYHEDGNLDFVKKLRNKYQEEIYG